jgi:hypothetical protein
VAASHPDLLPLGVELLVFADVTPSTEANCKQYAMQMGIDPARMILDSGHQLLFSKIDPGGGGSIGMPWDCVMDAQGMIYYWNFENGGDPMSAIDELLQVEIPEIPGKG